MVKMNETTAILRYLGKKFGYYPTNNLKMAAMVDADVDYINNHMPFFMKVSNDKDESPETQKLWDEKVKEIVSKLSKRIAERRTIYLVGDRPTIADFAMAGLAFSYWLNPMHSCGPMYTEISKLVID